MINGHNAMIGVRPRVATNVPVRTPRLPAAIRCVTRRWHPSLRRAQALAVLLVLAVRRAHETVQPRRLRRLKFSAPLARPRAPAVQRSTDAPRKMTATAATRAPARR